MQLNIEFNQIWIPLLVTSVLSLSPLAVADESRFKIAVGGFYSTSDSGMELESPLLDKPINIDFETDLQLVESEFLPFLELAYWFNERHAIYVDWKRLHRDATDFKITKPWDYVDPDTGDKYALQAGAEITTTFNVDIVRLGYGYDFFSDDKWDLIATVGLHVMWLELSFDGEIGACINESCDSINIDPDNVVYTDATAPLPDIGILASYKFADNWRVSAHAQYFYLKVDGIKGQLIDISTGLEFDFNNQFAANLSYKYYNVEADIEGDYSDINIHYGFYGPMLTLSYEF